MNSNKEFEKVVFVENKDKIQTPKYNHQKRKQQDIRIKAVVPYHRLNKKNNTPAFTTDIPSSTKVFKKKN